MKTIDDALSKYADLRAEGDKLTAEILNFTQGKSGKLSPEDMVRLRALMKRDKEIAGETRAINDSDVVKRHIGAE